MSEIIQGNLFSRFASAHAVQRELFTGPIVSESKCCECGENLVETPSGYLCCPQGHGKLLTEEQS